MPAPLIQREEPTRTGPMRSSRRQPSAWPRARKPVAALVIAAMALSAGVLASFLLVGRPQPLGASPSPSPVVVVAGPVVLSEPTAAVTSIPTPEPTQQPTPVEASSANGTPIPQPTAVAAAPPSQPVPTVAAPPVATVAPPAVPVPTPAPTAVVVAAATQPDAVVGSFYGHAVDGDLDAAYALWSDRMKATYPRQGNLDDRFASTASISFDERRVVEQTPSSATVQANFTEWYDSGSSRQFIGYWRLVLVEGRWLLDEPTY